MEFRSLGCVNAKIAFIVVLGFSVSLSLSLPLSLWNLLECYAYCYRHSYHYHSHIPTVSLYTPSCSVSLRL